VSPTQPGWMKTTVEDAKAETAKWPTWLRQAHGLENSSTFAKEGAMPNTPEALKSFLVLMQKYGIDYNGRMGYVNTGWHPILERLIVRLIGLGWDKQIEQVKEKFGRLRFYTGRCSDAIFEAIGEAESESSHTCEECGQPGKSDTWIKPGKIGWVLTLCDTHGAERRKKNDLNG